MPAVSQSFPMFTLHAVVEVAPRLLSAASQLRTTSHYSFRPSAPQHANTPRKREDGGGRGTTVVACAASDAAGNVGSASFNVIVQDTTGPVVTVPAAMIVEATGPGGAVVEFTVTATDLVDGPITASCTPASGSTFGITVTTVSCTATDSHGNRATGSFKVTVQYAPASLCGRAVLPPLEQASSTEDLTRGYKQGSTLPIKFCLCYADGTHVSTPNIATLAVLKASSTVDTWDPTIVLDSGSSNDNGLYFRYDSTAQQYIYNLSTKTMTVGTYRIIITLTDGTTIITYFELKK